MRQVPVKEIATADGGRMRVATVFDLYCASYGLDRGFGGANVAKGYDEDVPCTPAWAEKVTGVPRQAIVQVAREFAQNADITKGRSMVILGAGLNHWYHMDMSYRGIIQLLVMCGCIGQSGGGWSHYVGQEKLRPQTGWLPLAFALDWTRPPRQMGGTSFFYAHTDQWRYETLKVSELLSPTAPPGDWSGTLIDYNHRAERMGWLPSAPQLNANPLAVGRAIAQGGQNPGEAVVAGLRSGELQFASKDPDHPRNWPRNMFFWRSNVLGASGKGHEYFLKHFVGSQHGVVGTEDRAGIQRPTEVVWRDEAPVGKLDLMVNIDFRMSTTSLYCDVVLPTATWYEKHDLNTTDMHPFIHPLTAAVDPSWEARSDWNIFRGIAQKFSEVAPEVLGVEHDVVLMPTLHDTPSEIAQPYEPKDWAKGECEPIPGKTMPSVHIVERDYPATFARFTALGPLVEKLGNGSKGLTWNAEAEVRLLGDLNGRVPAGPTAGRPKVDTDIDACETILMLAPETNGAVAVKAWETLGHATGRDHVHLAEGREEEKIRFRDVAAQPRKIISSPTWSGIEHESICYNAGWTNVHELIPWRTLSGRQQLYQDHHWMRAFGEAFVTWKPPIDTRSIREALGAIPNGNKEVVLNFLTPHQKWGHPLHLHREPHHAEPQPRRPRGLDQRGRRPRRRDRGQRLDRGLQRQRRAHRAGHRQPAHHARLLHHVPRAGEAGEHRGLRGHERAGRHPQLGDADQHEAHPHDRGLRAALLRLQLLRHRGRQPRRDGDRPQDEPDQLVRQGSRRHRPGPDRQRRLGRTTTRTPGGRRMRNRAQIAMALIADRSDRPGRQEAAQ
ncbi:Respiratory nitrate reductase alpha chain [Rubellimicrobium mesophilum DSM 19309]|uniref:Respiratory nitrate reductase alpha chain n=1 Tax=Rubellimicrobium mesophilum DSM 19309 TaxID=442562 RepID=A0A017HEE1_9RHOB|nr:Respiratory nitrate reductase alpha chain [Rubellimicrobium mesophilum DSM 19309]